MTPTDTIFLPYLLPILEAEKANNGVTYIKMSDGNGMDRIMEDSLSEDVYPGIFIFRPKYSTKRIENHLLVAEFNTILYIWCKEGNNEREDQDAAYSKAEKIATSIIQKLQHDGREYKNYLDFDSIQLTPIIYLGVDAAYGFELNFRLPLAANELFC